MPNTPTAKYFLCQVNFLVFYTSLCRFFIWNRPPPGNFKPPSKHLHVHCPCEHHYQPKWNFNCITSQKGFMQTISSKPESGNTRAPKTMSGAYKVQYKFLPFHIFGSSFWYWWPVLSFFTLSYFWYRGILPLGWDLQARRMPQALLWRSTPHGKRRWALRHQNKLNVSQFRYTWRW